MTSLAARILGTADNPEDAPMTTPQRRLPASPGVPWWAGVYGMDPAIPVDDWAVAAQCTAMACAVHVLGADAGRPERWVLPRKAAPAARWAGWLLEAPDWADATRRRLALRLACDTLAGTDADDILQVAADLHAATSSR